MREVNALPARTRHGGEQLARGEVREMTMPSADPLLQRPRPTRVVLQQLRAMVRLDHDDFAFANALADVLRGVPEIGEPRDRAARREEIAVVAAGETKPDRFLGVVRNGE